MLLKAFLLLVMTGFSFSAFAGTGYCKYYNGSAVVGNGPYTSGQCLQNTVSGGFASSSYSGTAAPERGGSARFCIEGKTAGGYVGFTASSCGLSFEPDTLKPSPTSIFDLVTSEWKEPCPAGQVPANTIPELATTITTCVPQYAQRCSTLGVDVNAFVPKCSELLTGSPSVCLNSDMGQFSIAGCPTIDCGNGVTVIYPAKCPTDIVCPAGFTKTVIWGDQESCIKAAPDNDQQQPCVISGTQPICAGECVTGQGGNVCLQEKTVQPPGSTCYTVNSKLYCLTNTPQETKTKTIETQPDGTVKETTTIDPGIKNQPPQQQVVIKDQNGNVISQTGPPSPGAVLSAMQQQNDKSLADLGAIKQNTRETATNTKSIETWLKGDGTPVLDGHVLDGALNQAVVDNQNDAISSLNGTTDPYKNMVGTDLTGWVSGMFPGTAGACSGGIHTTWKTFTIDFDPCNKLAALREILAWVFSVLAILDILKITFRGQS